MPSTPHSKLFKVAMSLSLAGIVRALRRGPRNAARRLAAAYDVIDPDATDFQVEEKTLRHLGEIPVIELTAVAKPAVIRVDSTHRFVDGALPDADLVALLCLLQDWRPSHILEIGTFNGATTAALALNAPGATVHTVDLPLGYDPARDDASPIPKDDFHLIKERRVGDAYASLPEAKQIVQHFADTALWDFAPAKGCSFFFIDGAHTYEYAKNDTEKCLSVAAPRSRFLLHDCDERHPDVVRYVRDLVRQGTPACRLSGTSLAYFDRSG